jgi:hypothetical protein
MAVELEHPQWEWQAIIYHTPNDDCHTPQLQYPEEF